MTESATRGIQPIDWDFEREFFGRNWTQPAYYGRVIKEIDPHANEKALWVYGARPFTQEGCQNRHTPTLGFTGTQNLTNKGFRVTHLVAQVAAALGICTVAGNAYGVDLTVMLGTLSRDEFCQTIQERIIDPPVRQIAVLPSGILSRAPKFSYVERGLLADDGLYISLLCSNAPLRQELLSPRDRLIVELSDALVVTEAGNRGTFDTIVWAIETRTPIIAVDWGRTDKEGVRSGCHILRELKDQAEREPGQRKLSELTKLLREPFEALTSLYHFSCAHSEERFDEVPRDGSGNRKGYQSPRELGEHLLDKILEYQNDSSSPMINLIDYKDITPPHNGEPLKRNDKAREVSKRLWKLIPRTSLTASSGRAA